MSTAGAPVKVLLVDDHALFREGVAEILAADAGVRVVGEAGNGEEAVALAQKERPDVVLLDIEMPGPLSAKETLRRVLRASPSSRVVVLTMHDEPRLVRDLLSEGAQAYVVKSATRQELLSTVHTIDRDGDRVVLSVSRATLERLEGGADVLSSRELEVLSLAAKGRSNIQIASELHISEGTVKRHLTNTYAKLHVTSRMDAVNRAVSMGLVNIGGLSEPK